MPPNNLPALRMTRGVGLTEIGMQNRGSRNLTELYEQLDRDEQWGQLAARADRRRWLVLVIGALLLGLALKLGGVI